MKNPHKQFPGKMDQAKKDTFKKGYKTLKGGNVKEGYSKLTHVKLFENFDEVPAEKWFVAQGSGEKFKFPAKDMDEAKAYAHKAWNAEVLGEATDEMEFEDTPMDEGDMEENMYAVIYAILDAYDNMPELQPKIEKFFTEYKVNNGQDTDDVVRDAIKSDMAVSDAERFAAENRIKLDEAKVNEGSYTDFLTSHGNDLKNAVTKIKKIADVYDDKIEDLADAVEKAMEPYDEEVGNQIDHWTGDSNISTDKIAKFAIENQDRSGTEPRMVLDAIDDFYNIMMK